MINVKGGAQAPKTPPPGYASEPLPRAVPLRTQDRCHNSLTTSQ